MSKVTLTICGESDSNPHIQWTSKSLSVARFATALTWLNKVWSGLELISNSSGGCSATLGEYNVTGAYPTDRIHYNEKLRKIKRKNLKKANNSPGEAPIATTGGAFRELMLPIAVRLNESMCNTRKHSRNVQNKVGKLLSELDWPTRHNERG